MSEARINEAIEKRIKEKIRDIIHALKRDGLFRGQYKEDQLEIIITTGWETVGYQAKWCGRPVFKCEEDDFLNPGITLYRPDIPEWETKLNEIYKKRAHPIIIKQKSDSLKENWGISTNTSERRTSE